jgi:hypothetical protein
MVNKYLAMSLGALIALAPLGSLTQAQAQSTAPVVANPTAPHTGTHKSRMRHRSTESHRRARASAEHVRTLRHPAHKTHPAPVAPKS